MQSILINIINMNCPTLTAETATQRLGIARQTLYAYVSRGLVRAIPDPDAPGRSRYHAGDIAVLLERRARGRARKAVASSTIDWGEPVLPSRITRIADGRFFYRGRDAVALAESATLEEAAALLWEGEPGPLPVSDYAPGRASDRPILRCLRAAVSLSHPAGWGRPDAALHQEAALLLRRMAEAAADAPARQPIHLAFARAWGVRGAEVELLRRALVLIADHELNASAFAVRIVASTGAALPACAAAGLAALSGPLHGGMTERVAALLAEPGMREDPETGLAARLARGDTLPGFGHRLYPAGDPRAAALFAAIKPGRFWQRLIAAGTALTGTPPNVDLALAALERRLDLPAGAALALFATGRTAGWIAHALEQRASGQLIRPRAHYVGE